VAEDEERRHHWLTARPGFRACASPQVRGSSTSAPTLPRSAHRSRSSPSGDTHQCDRSGERRLHPPGGEGGLARVGARPPSAYSPVGSICTYTTSPRRAATSASAREECVDGRLVVVAREERGHNEDSHKAHENEHDSISIQRKPGTMTHGRRKIERSRVDAK